MHSFGILGLGVLLIFTAKERWDIDNFISILSVSLLPIIPILIYISVKTPKLSEVSFDLGANTETTAGFGSNQMSTILGSALVILSIILYSKRKLFEYKYIIYAMIIYVFFRGLLTFSRGGMLSAISSILIFNLILFWGNSKNILKVFGYFLLISFFSLMCIYYVNIITHNQLLLRYSGETYETNLGDKEKDLNTITTARSGIAITDLKIFKDYPFLGVGPGQSQYFRKYYGGYQIIAHTEYSRLLSEHGIGGLFVVIILTFFPFFWISRIKNRFIKATSAALFIYAILNSFHAATRVNITVVFFLLASIPIIELNIEKNQKKIL
jgi:hypothetical protein